MGSRYAELADCADPILAVTPENLDAAEQWVDGELWKRGINPALLVLPNERLKTLAVTWAKSLAAEDGGIGQDSPLVKKSERLQKTALLLASQLTKESLGIAAATGSGFGFISLGRG